MERVELVDRDGRGSERETRTGWECGTWLRKMGCRRENLGQIEETGYVSSSALKN
jgi:hypothetical protein